MQIRAIVRRRLNRLERLFANAIAIALLLSTTVLQAADPNIQVDAAVAFARLAGAVRYFHPGDAVQRVKWDQFLEVGISRLLVIDDRARIGPELQQMFEPWATDVQIANDRTKLATIPQVDGSDTVQWIHVGYGKGLLKSSYVSVRTGRDDPVPLEAELQAVLEKRPSFTDVDLGSGWWARVPLKMSSTRALITPAQQEALARLERDYPGRKAEPDRVQSVAAGIALWSVARHFYPYWSDVTDQWDQALPQWIASQPERQTRKELLDRLRRLTVGLSDGHANVVDQRVRVSVQYLPISVRLLGQQWVVDGSATPEVKPGDVIATIDGRSANEVMNERVALNSGSPQWRAQRAALDFTGGEKDSSVAMGLDRSGTRVSVTLTRSNADEVTPPRPEPIAQVSADIWYVDLSRFKRKDFEDLVPRMKTAKAVIFDLRGYPKAEARYLPDFWTRKREGTRWMFQPLVTEPFSPSSRSRSSGWDVEPRTELANARKFLLTDANAISFSESLAGFFAFEHQGTIVGEPTAGANGNIVLVQLPGSFGFVMTGMRVTRHDGTTMHGQGFKPDVAVTPTLEGIREGRDELLARALSLAQKP
jgi:hypothetical protein